MGPWKENSRVAAPPVYHHTNTRPTRPQQAKVHAHTHARTPTSTRPRTSTHNLFPRVFPPLHTCNCYCSTSYIYPGCQRDFFPFSFARAVSGEAATTSHNVAREKKSSRRPPASRFRPFALSPFRPFALSPFRRSSCEEEKPLVHRVSYIMINSNLYKMIVVRSKHVLL